MKYGKEYQQLLETSNFPEEWKSSAIEYRQLKKIIKDVVAELAAMGFSSDILHKLLVTEASDSYNSVPDPASVNSSMLPGVKVENDDELLALDFENDRGSPTTLKAREMAIQYSLMNVERERNVDPLRVNIHPMFEEQGIFASNLSSTDGLYPQHCPKFRLRLLSKASQTSTNMCSQSVRPLSVSDILEETLMDYSQGALKASGNITAMRNLITENRRQKATKKTLIVSHGDVKAEYVLTSNSIYPVPQLRLHLHSSVSSQQTLSTFPIPSSLESGSEAETADDSNDHRVYLKNTQQGSSHIFDSLSTPALPSTSTSNKVKEAESSIWAISSSTEPEELTADEFGDLPLGEAATKEDSSVLPTVTPSAAGSEIIPLLSDSLPVQKGRELVIPLASDLAFFALLTTALTSLSLFHAEQQKLFQQSVEKLCVLISRSISPSAERLPRSVSPGGFGDNNCHTSAPINHPFSSKSFRKDLYAWREIFTLWIESQIFESTTERDRGERSVDEAEKRLQKFTNEVIKRGLDNRRTIKGKKIREPWDEFLRLNLLLLDLKRFQIANIVAARKILKKHDKRTALTASAGFHNYVRQTLSAHVDKDGNVSTWAFYNISLPHVLLTSLTNTLLPVLPSIDDYTCLICTSIAFKPIRLPCKHLFCVRCLVKMQKAGKGECPLCRSNIVLLADKSCLDLAVMNFMKEWFPKEVRIKQKENQEEIIKERALESGIDTRCAIM
ncbi:hypothetical protein L204_102223 [Cryptococcus depauperatus]